MIELNENRILFLISAGLAIFIFVLGWIKSIRDKKTTALGFIENKCIALFSPLINSVDDLKITYKKELINNNLIYYQATIYNSGVSDIPQTAIYKPLTLKLPENFIWKAFNIYDKSEGLKLSSVIDGVDLKIEWDLFKKEELFRFDTIIEVLNVKPEELKTITTSITNLLSEKISFNDSRISNLQVGRKNLKSKKLYLRWSKTLIYCLIIVLNLNLIFFNKKDVFIYDVRLGTDVKRVEFVENNKDVMLLDSFGDYFLLDTLSNDLVVLRADVIKKENLTFKSKIYRNVMIILCVIMIMILHTQKRIRNKREKMNLISPGDWNPYKEEEEV